MKYKHHALAAALWALSCAAAHSEEIVVSCGGYLVPQCERDGAAWGKATGNTVKVVPAPSGMTDALGLYQNLFNSKSSDIDVMQIDVVWGGLLAPYLVDLKPYLKNSTDYLKQIIAAYEADGKLVAIPQFVDIGVLYYRKDLLEKYHKKVPQTWDELIETSKEIQDGERADNKNFWGVAMHAFSDEGLTCEASEWANSYNGAFLDDSGKIVSDAAAMTAAFSTASKYIGNVAPEGSLTQDEEAARGVFQSGNAAFMRNWPYAISLMNADDSAIKGKFDVAPLPKGGDGGKHSGTLGGNGYGVSMFSKHADLAAQFVVYMGSAEAQKKNATEFSVLPSLKALYDDKQVRAAHAYIGNLPPIEDILVARPAVQTKAKYNRVSQAIASTFADVMSHKLQPEAAAEVLTGKLKQIYKGKW